MSIKVCVHYHGGKVLDFIVNQDLRVVDFTAMASQHGKIRKVEFL